MKTLFVSLLIATTLCGIGQNSFAQNSEKKTDDEVKIHVRVTEGSNDNAKTTARTYTYKNLTEEEKDAKVKAIMDSLRTDKGKTNKRISVTVDDKDVRKEKEPKKHVRVYSDSDDFKNNDDFLFFDGKAFADRMKRIEKEIHPRIRRMEMNIDNWSKDFEPQFREFWGNDTNFRGSHAKPSTIRGLEAFPNNPDKYQMNIRFYAPEKGDISITITDIKGKQVSKKEIKDFSGDYVGQIDMPKEAKGTYFLTVVQLEDGAVKRFVIE